jgi:hypothetical protein
VRRPGWWFWGPFLFGLFFAAGGVVFLAGASRAGAGSGGLNLTGVIWLVIGVVGLGVAAYARHDIRSPDEPPRVAGRPEPEEERRLRATGVPGRATISSFKYLGRHLDGETLVELGLSVVVGGAAHDTVDRLFVPVPVARRLAVGATVPVTVAPGDPDRFAVDWSGLGATP